METRVAEMKLKPVCLLPHLCYHTSLSAEAEAAEMALISKVCT